MKRVVPLALIAALPVLSHPASRADGACSDSPVCGRVVSVSASSVTGAPGERAGVDVTLMTHGAGVAAMNAAATTALPIYGVATSIFSATQKVRYPYLRTRGTCR